MGGTRTVRDDPGANNGEPAQPIDARLGAIHGISVDRDAALQPERVADDTQKMSNAMSSNSNDDPRKLRALVMRASDLARDHEVGSVVVGLLSPAGELAFPEFIEFLRAALRVEDGIFRMTRERVVVHLADVDAAQAQEVVERLLGQFRAEIPTAQDLDFQLRALEIKPGQDDVSVRDVLVKLFAPDSPARLH